MYVATGRGSHAAGAPAGSSASEPAMSLVIFFRSDLYYIYKFIYAHCQARLKLTGMHDHACMNIHYRSLAKFVHA